MKLETFGISRLDRLTKDKLKAFINDLIIYNLIAQTDSPEVAFWLIMDLQSIS